MIKIINIGSGAVGSLYSSLLNLNPEVEVYNICRSNYKVVKEQGYKIFSRTYGNYEYKPKQVFKSIEEAASFNIQFDYCLITLKALPDQYDIPTMISPIISEHTSIILVQNGLDVELPFITKHPNNLLISCVSNVAVTQTESGIIKEEGRSFITLSTFPCRDENKPASKLPDENEIIKITELFNNVNIAATLVPDISVVRWNKMLWNGSFSPICILSGGCHTLNLHQDKEAEDLVRKTMKEIWDLAEAAIGYPFPDWVPETDLETYLHRTKNFAYKPSLLVDYERKNPLELEATLGNLVRKAKSINHPVPLCESFYVLLKMADRKNRGII